MSGTLVSHISLADLDRAFAACEPTAILVPPRILRRVIKQDRHVPGMGLVVPHRKTYVIHREDLLKLADREELDLPVDAPLTDTVILVARPDAGHLAALDTSTALVKYWRLLFHAQVHVALERQIAEGKLTQIDVRRRVRDIGPTAFDEVRLVLRQEDFLLPPIDDRATYVEFAAVYLELRHFADELLESYFPGIHDFDRLEEHLSQDLDVEALLNASRLEGTAYPEFSPPADDAADMPPITDSPAGVPQERQYRKLMDRADRAGLVGNVVRAALLRSKAARVAPSELAASARTEARADLERLARRLQAALDLKSADADAWTAALVPLLDAAPRGIWTPEARMLYDLQKACVDHERGIYSLDIVEWALSLGRKPIKRPLPSQREVLMSKHVRGAAGRLAAVRLPDDARGRLATLLAAAVARAEERLRGRLRPLVAEGLAGAGLRPANLPERVALKKLIEELLDRIVQRGFLTMSDLRDAISRNNLKLPDLGGIKDLLLGDELLRADRRLAAALDGVYRRGEIYLRWPQRLSSLAFGTRVGRFITQYAAIPFGGAYLALSGLEHIVNPVLSWLAQFQVEVSTPWSLRLFLVDFLGPDGEADITTPLSVALLGVFLLGLIHWLAFRKAGVEVASKTWSVVRAVCYDLPRWFVRLPLVRKFLDSPIHRLLYRFGFRPLVLAALLWFACLALKGPPAPWGGVLLFLGTNVLMNSRLGRNVDELLTDWTARGWHEFRMRVVTALFRFVMDLFHRLVETIERLLYSVDEWLRFKSGEGRLSLVIKATLGVVWFFVNYVIRIYVTLLIEPQVNPIKHFPVVTVSHKIILPFSFTLTRYLAAPFAPLVGTVAANFVAGTTVFLLPGVFGFLVWELKENWRLYGANRPRRIQPVLVGRHGETLFGLLKPGFHSGTVPKLFARLRRAERRTHANGRKPSLKHRAGLEHARHSVRDFVQRDLLVLLDESRRWEQARVSVGDVDLATNRVLVELRCPDISSASAWLSFDEQAGWLLAGVERPGWLARLSAQRREVFSVALAGLYKCGGIDLVREQVAPHVPPSALYYEVADDRVVAWPDDGGPPRTITELRSRGTDTPEAGWTTPLDNLSRGPAPVFRQEPIRWDEWVRAWEQDHAGEQLSMRLDEALPVL